MNDSLPAIIPDPADAPEFDGDGNAILTGRTTAWMIDGPNTAEWAMTRYATAATALKALGQQKQDWEARVNDWYDAATRPLVRTIEFFQHHLEGWAVEQRELSPVDSNGEPTVKTVQLVTGRINTRSSGERIEVSDAAAFIEWAKKVGLNGVIKTTESVDLAALRKALVVDDVTTGELDDDGTPIVVRCAMTFDRSAVPGVRVVPADVSASVTPTI